MREIQQHRHEDIAADAVDRLRVELGIRPDQKAAWKTFAAQLEICNELLANSARCGSELDGPDLTSALQSEAEVLSARIETIAALWPALDGLFAVLCPRQRVRADRLLRKKCGVFASDRRLALAAAVADCGLQKHTLDKHAIRPMAA